MSRRRAHPDPAMARKPRPASTATAAAPVVLDGEWTIYQAPALRDRLRDLLASGDGAQALALDLSGVTEIDSAGFQLLVSARVSAAGTGRTLRIVAASGAVQDLAATYAYSL